MGKALVLAEKPSVGRDIARVLNCQQKGDGCLEGKDYVVTWALGHLVTLGDPELYDKKYATWRLEDLPILPRELQLVVIKSSAKQFGAVSRLMKRQDITQIIIATDAGREGELVARWIIEKANCRKPIKRLWISSVTDQAIKTGFQQLKPGKDYENLYASAAARAEADWLVGINATRALTTKYNAQLSCGRVQTPTLAMIAQREQEIQCFQPKPFYGLEAVASGLKFTWQDQQTKAYRTFDQSRVEVLLKSLKGEAGKITGIQRQKKKSYCPALYDLTELQRDCNRIFGFSPKETLSIMQNLYEHHKVLTYPRTDSRYITTDMVPTLKDRIRACSVGPYKPLGMKLLQGEIRAHSSFVNDQKVTDHHAIIPTEQSVFLGDLSDRERKVYDLVVRRFLAVMLPPFEYEQTTVKLTIKGEIFFAKGKVVLHQGWRAAYDHQIQEENPEEELKEQLLPPMEEGKILSVDRLIQTQGKTTPPPPFNEATLLSAMENPKAFMAGEDRELIKTLGETGGLGTVATRGDIIEKLFNSGVIEKRGKDIWITSKGKQLLELVPQELKSPALTAQWEQKLGAIAKGQLKPQAFLKEMRVYAQDVVTEIKNTQGAFRHDNLTREKCPQCGKYLMEVKGKRGKMLVCQDRSCGHRKTVSTITNARCPNCHKRLELRGEGEGRYFLCQCGHKEKLSAFNERKKKEKSTASQREVARFMKEQQKEANKPINTALADALAKLKL